ncbi:MAG: hypothetical protein JXA67_21085 [Micromonosporaceae bacterium]|nr:hypothetical protein [Micromonosporaceae bacterium]
MSALPGGAADKIGNRYEAWWTLLRLADVLRGDASCLRLEPLGAGGSGIEFWIDETDGRWCEQAKDASSRGSWTLHRLTTEGFLAAIVDHLADGHRVRFVASTPAKELNDLAERARAAETLQEYREVLTDAQQKHFKDLVTTWGVATETAWLHLRLVHVEHQPPEQLRRIVRLTYEILVQGDPDTVIKHLRGWLDDVLHQRLTGPLVWKHLQEKKFARRLLPGDPTTLEALANTVDRHRRRVDSTLPTTGVAAQPYGSQLIARVTDTGSEQVLVLHGRAGSGKSTIAADAAQQLSSVGWFVGVVSMDGSCAACQTASALGTVTGLPASPAVALGGVANGSPAMLVIDQLDAVTASTAAECRMDSRPSPSFSTKPAQCPISRFSLSSGQST